MLTDYRRIAICVRSKKEYSRLMRVYRKKWWKSKDWKELNRIYKWKEVYSLWNNKKHLIIEYRDWYEYWWFVEYVIMKQYSVFHTSKIKILDKRISKYNKRRNDFFNSLLKNENTTKD